MTDHARRADRGQIVMFAAVAGAAWLSPFLLDRLARWSVGHGAFDWPWLALHFADTVTAIGLIAALAFALLMRHATDTSAVIAKWGGLAALAFVFGLVPVVKWNTGLSSDTLFAGLLPMLDAQSYYAAALSFLQTGHLTEWATRRPLTATQLAGLLMLSGDDFRLVLLLLVAGCGTATLLMVAAFYRAYGWAAAALGGVSLFAFIYSSLGTTMSESLGFTAGGAGFVLLWEGARKARPSLVLGALALLSIGLTARAGALFVLPSLALWTGWRFAAGRRFHWGWTMAALAAGAVGFVVSQLLIITVGAPGQLAFSNFASTLYGLVIGGAPWTQVFIDAPQLAALPEGEQAAAIYRLAWDHALQSPLDPIMGVLVRYNEFFFDLRWHSYVPNKLLRLLILVLAVSGIVHCCRHRREPLCALALAGLAGILLSVPFLGDGGSRVFAASHGFSAALVAIGSVGLQRWLARSPIRQEQVAANGSVISLAAWILASATTIPILVALGSGERTNALGRVSTALPCAPDHSGLWILTLHHGSVLVCRPGEICPNGIRFESLTRTNIWKNSQISDLGPYLPARLTSAIDMATGNGLWLMASSNQAMPEGLFEACVTPRAGWLDISPPRT